MGKGYAEAFMARFQKAVSRGFHPDEMDVWRVAATGGQPERITHHNSRVAYPAFLDDQTLVVKAYLLRGASGWWRRRGRVHPDEVVAASPELMLVRARS